jgi:hypothetical protein
MIKDLKDLKKFFAICREYGVKHADLTSNKFEFGDLPSEQSQNTVSSDIPFEEQVDEFGIPLLATYSVRGQPSNDPNLGAQKEAN